MSATSGVLCATVPSASPRTLSFRWFCLLRNIISAFGLGANDMIVLCNNVFSYVAEGQGRVHRHNLWSLALRVRAREGERPVVSRGLLASWVALVMIIG